MGKNPNAARQKKDHRKGGKDKNEKDGDQLEELQEEAARLGCEVWEIEKVKARMQQQDSDSDEDSDEDEEKKIEKTKKPAASDDKVNPP